MTGARRDLERRYRRIAPFYDLLDGAFEYGRYRRIRPALFAGLSGRILEAGVGTGRNLSSHPAGAEVTAIDLSAAMLRRARRRLRDAPASVALVRADVTRLPFADVTFDAAVESFLLCTLPDSLQVPALEELARVTRPDGKIRLLEFIPPKGAFARWSARLWAPWARWAYGAHLDRDVTPAIAEAGLEITARRELIAGKVCLFELARA